MNRKQLEELGFYSNSSNTIDQTHDSGLVEMDLGWFGLRVDLKTLTPKELVAKIYEKGHEVGFKKGKNDIRQSINNLLEIEE